MSSFESAIPDDLARDAAVARVTPPTAPASPEVLETGFVRVDARVSRGLAFSFSLTAVARVVRTTRRVCGVRSTLAENTRNSLGSVQGCLKTC